jgi:predicted DCC family thiol-disulfide oxidoreductase YuxK
MRAAPPDWPDGLILFDGVCALCSRWVRAVIARDRSRRFRFASIQSPYGQTLAGAAGVDPLAPDTNVVALDGQLLFKSDAALAVLGELDGLGWTRALRAVPKPARDFVYDRVARNRYVLFGKHESCFRPPPQDRDRFLDDAPPPAAGG